MSKLYSETNKNTMQIELMMNICKADVRKWIISSYQKEQNSWGWVR